MIIRRTSGRVVELSSVFVSSNTRPRRNRRKGATTAQKQDENERDCVKRLARTINCNFAHGDLLLTLKYDNAGLAELEKKAEALGMESREDAILEAAAKESSNFLRRLGRILAKEGEQLRYIVVDSDMDGESGEAARPHHHLIVPRVAFEQAARLWPLGTVDYQILRAQDDYTPLAEYLCRQVRRRADRKKYRCSRNLKKPIVNEHWAKPGEELRPDRGAKLMQRNEWEAGKPQYIRFIKQPKAGEIIGHDKAQAYPRTRSSGAAEKARRKGGG